MLALLRETQTCVSGVCGREPCSWKAMACFFGLQKWHRLKCIVIRLSLSAIRNDGSVCGCCIHFEQTQPKCVHGRTWWKARGRVWISGPCWMIPVSLDLGQGLVLFNLKPSFLFSPFPTSIHVSSPSPFSLLSNFSIHFSLHIPSLPTPFFVLIALIH